MRKKEGGEEEGGEGLPSGGLPLGTAAVTYFRMDTGGVDRPSLCFPSRAVAARIVTVPHRGRVHRTSLFIGMFSPSLLLPGHLLCSGAQGFLSRRVLVSSVGSRGSPHSTERH